MPKMFQVCRCITLHTYSAHVTLGGWDVVTHVCRCGRVHFEEGIPDPQKTDRAPREKMTLHKMRRRHG
jgi:hypothetical protein